MINQKMRLRDFIADDDGWLYAVSNYDNDERVGCVLRYTPRADGERVGADGKRYHKYDFGEAFATIAAEKPEYLDTVHRVPLADISRVYKPDLEICRVAANDPRIPRLLDCFGVPDGEAGCTASQMVGLANDASDIDMVVYGKWWFVAQQNLIRAVANGEMDGLSEELWEKVYNKRVPEIDYETFLVHEKRKWNRGAVDGTYFDLLFSRSYDQIVPGAAVKGKVLGMKEIEAVVTDASLSFDSPAVYLVDHEEFSKVLSFTHTYSGQAKDGELIRAKGVVEEHGDEHWLIVGTTREAKGEYIISQSLLESL